GGSGDIEWNPGTVAGSSSATLRYLVDVFPLLAGSRIPVTGSVSSNGTTAIFLDETGNTSQARATYTFGPLCELAITANSGATLFVDIADFGFAYNAETSQVS